jgi:valyl-tRNA synthetase
MARETIKASYQINSKWRSNQSWVQRYVCCTVVLFNLQVDQKVATSTKCPVDKIYVCQTTFRIEIEKMIALASIFLFLTIQSKNLVSCNMLMHLSSFCSKVNPRTISRHNMIKRLISEESIKQKQSIRQKSSRLFSTLPSSASKFYITTPIYYVNGEPHLGHAYTSVMTDIIARFHRNFGNDVFFLSGTDEHGQKVEQSAAKASLSPIEFADRTSDKFRNLLSILGCSHNDFIRTTEDRHKEVVKEVWNILQKKDQIYLGSYEGWYSIRDEAFYQESELIDGKAPTGAEVEWVKEESYFFKLSQYTEKLLQFYESNPQFIQPKAKRNEVISFVKQEGGLKDLSISRTTFTWGIPVPNDSKHVIYVWLDALINYISALGSPTNPAAQQYQQYWPANLHIVGKDILRFHAVFWPAFLMAAELPIPQVCLTSYN